MPVTSRSEYPWPMSAPIIATLDGQIHPVDQPLLRPDDLGVLRGDGVFETTLSVDGQPRDLDEHLQRLATSAGMLGIALPPDEDWRIGVKAVTDAWQQADGEQEMVMRLVATRGNESIAEKDRPATCFVTGGSISPTVLSQRDGVRIRLLSRGFAGAEIAAMPWLLPGAKSLSYAINMAAVRHAASLGDDDVVFVGTDGKVLEGPTSTVVLAQGDTLTTPNRDGILDSITVRRLFAAAEQAGWTTRYADVLPADLHEADGAYVASSVRMLSPIVSLDGVDRPVGPRTAELASLLRG